MSSSDPLAFFAGTDSSSSDSEDEDKDLDEKDDVVPEGLVDKLPSPDSLFASVGKPSFLHDPSSGRVNWDNLVKNRTVPAELNIHAFEGGGRYAAIAPPTGTEEYSLHNKKVHSSLTAAIVNTYTTTSGEISAPPVCYSTKEVDPKFRTVSDGAEGDGKRQDMPAPVNRKHNLSSSNRVTDETGSAVKKQKTDNFRQKEKRKRDVGQTSRGKSYVEEEKRILRQSFAVDEIMS